MSYWPAAVPRGPRAHVYTRVKRLLDDGVVRRSRSKWTPRGRTSRTRDITIEGRAELWRQIPARLAALPWVGTSRCSGDFDVLLLVAQRLESELAADLVFTHIQSCLACGHAHSAGLDKRTPARPPRATQITPTAATVRR